MSAVGAVGEPSRERPIPEILGYHQDWPNGSAGYKVWFKDGKPMPLVWQPTVDDMLAWLRSNSEAVDCIEPTPSGGWEVKVTFDASRDACAVDDWISGPTVFDAVAEAVRVVAGVLGQPGEAGES